MTASKKLDPIDAAITAISINLAGTTGRERDAIAVNRDFMVTVLRYGGHEPMEATNGLAALAIARAEHPDLIVTDLLMPGMDGLELVKQIRADAALRTSRVVFCSPAF